jgi:SAM-dependent methyltransferase
MYRVNYDDVAPLYDEPARDHVADPNLISFVNTRSDLPRSTIRILDIGCGTGKQLAANRCQARVHAGDDLWQHPTPTRGARDVNRVTGR